MGHRLTVNDSANPNTVGVNLRSAAAIAPKNIVKRLPMGASLTALEDDDVVRARIGQTGQWLKVQDDAGSSGFIMAEFVKATVATPSFVVAVNADLDVFQSGGLVLRDAPATGASLAQLPPGTLLEVLEPAETALPKVGVNDQWLNVRDPQSRQGYVAAWLVHLRDTLAADVLAQRVAIAVADAPLLDAAQANSSSQWRITAGTPLQVLDTGEWYKNLGDAKHYVHVRSYAYKEGYVQASRLTAPAAADKRALAVDSSLPFGECAWLYGLHDAYDRGLFSGSGRTGWVLFTERVVSSQGNTAYEDWSQTNNYGVIARLNNDYGGTGTIPAPAQYDQFAQQCAQWVRNSRGCHIWIIGNEMNNPREWPNGQSIAPEQYADCFNRVRSAIKAVQPTAIVVPGAVDPYQGPQMSCLEWLTRMFAAIADLDGIALHCYTQGYQPQFVTDLGRFGDDPLRWQYYHFRCYATFLDVVPARWRGKPVYITETDPHGTSPWAGGQNGWVQAAYAEIQRWNQQPHTQQIQSLILYRWSRDDIYSITDKPGIQNDIRATIAGTDYRWRR
ncbi:MAG: SH3 domain-containing protein [Chloroflexi bacterium]|nr:SH3 domain-containing protein [Chloroflexota bacterium]